LYYFEGYYKKQVKSPAVKRLRAIQFDKIPKMAAGGCIPSFDVYHCEGLNIERVFSFPATKEYR
jgi:hypothetical protein